MSPRRKTRSKPATAPIPLNGNSKPSSTKNATPAAEPSTPGARGRGQSTQSNGSEQRRGRSGKAPVLAVEINGNGKSRAKGKQNATAAAVEEHDAAQVPLPPSEPTSASTSASKKRKRGEALPSESPSSVLSALDEAHRDGAKSRTPPWQRNNSNKATPASRTPSRKSSGKDRRRMPTPPPPPLPPAKESPDSNPHENGEVLGDASKEDNFTLVSGTLLSSRYRVTSVLGRGHFSTTYLAKSHSPSHEFVAIKRLLSPYNSIGDAEAKLLRWLMEHPRGPPRNLVTPVSDFSFENENHFHLVLEALDPKRPLSLPECTCWNAEEHTPLSCPTRHRAFAKLFSQILSGLQELHTHHVIHADLTPGNILYVPNTNDIKIIDMGNAIWPEHRESYTDDYNVQTSHYRAPEILLGAGPIGRRIDVWSAGIIALELLLGGEVVGDGMDGAELLRPPVEGRDALVRRIVELFGSVKSCEGGMYWQDIYKDLSTKFTFIKGSGRVPVGEKGGLLESVLSRLKNDGLQKFLTKMLIVDASRRATVESLLRDPWLLQETLGEWGRILANPPHADAGNHASSELGVAVGVGMQTIPLERDSPIPAATLASEPSAVTDQRNPDLSRQRPALTKSPSSPPSPRKRLINGNSKISPEAVSELLNNHHDRGPSAPPEQSNDDETQDEDDEEEGNQEEDEVMLV